MTFDNMLEVLNNVEFSLDREKKEVTKLLLQVSNDKKIINFLDNLRDILGYAELATTTACNMLRVRSAGHYNDADESSAIEFVLKTELDKLENKVMLYAGKQGYENPDILDVVLGTIGDAI